MLPYNKKLVQNAHTLRKNMTPEEKHLWYDFLKKLPCNVRRQHNIESYILDFYIADQKIAIEVDGRQHLTDAHAKADAQRDEKLDAEMHAEAEKRIKTALIIAEIAKNENIQVSSTDFETKIFEISRLYGVPREQIVEEIQRNPNLLYSLNQQIMAQKVTQFLLDNAKINEKA